MTVAAAQPGSLLRSCAASQYLICTVQPCRSEGDVLIALVVYMPVIWHACTIPGDELPINAHANVMEAPRVPLGTHRLAACESADALFGEATTL